jgi:hypothetical protein
MDRLIFQKTRKKYLADVGKEQKADEVTECVLNGSVKMARNRISDEGVGRFAYSNC